MTKIELAPCPRCGGSDVHFVAIWHCKCLGLCFERKPPCKKARCGARIFHYVQCRTCLCRTVSWRRRIAASLWKKGLVWVPARPELRVVEAAP
jgi:hypothetical protein